MRLSKRGKSIFTVLGVFIFFLFLFSFFPRFDGEDVFNLVFPKDKSLIFREGRSDLVVWSFLKLKEGSFCFHEGDSFRGITLGESGESVDFFKVKNSECFMPMVSILISMLFLFPFSFLSSSADGLAKALVFGNIFYAGILMVFTYLTIRLFVKRFAFLLTLIAGMGTGVMVYSYSIFPSLIQAAVFSSFLYFSLLLYFKKSKPVFFPLLASFFLLVLAMPYRYPTNLPYFFEIITGLVLRYSLLLALPLLFLLFREDLFSKKKKYSFILVYILAVISIHALFNYELDSWNWDFSISSSFETPESSVDFEIFGASPRRQSHSNIYWFNSQNSGLFLDSYGFFASMFSERGFIYNSPFLLFGFIGLLLLDDKKLRNALLLILLINLAVSIVSPAWHGGFTPRYVRHFFPSILILSLLSFTYISKNRNLFVRILFLLLVIISILNVSSIAVRQDWNYENPANVFSYDYALLPLMPFNSYDSAETINSLPVS